MTNLLTEYLHAATGSGVGQYLIFDESTPLMFITHRTDRYTELDEVKMALEGGCTWIQLRMKDNLNLETAKAVSDYVRLNGFSTNSICINDNVEIAIKVHADCVHLGKNDMPVSEARKFLYEHWEEDMMSVGATANTFEDIVRADEEGAAYVGLGPFRFTETKKNLSPELGLEGYRHIMQQMKEENIKIPVFAIGGILLEDVKPLMETGITGIAVSGAIVHADNPVAETRRFVEEVNKYAKKYTYGN